MNDPIGSVAEEHALNLAAHDPQRDHHLPAEQDYRNANRDLGRDMTSLERYHYSRVFASEYRRLTEWRNA